MMMQRLIGWSLLVGINSACSFNRSTPIAMSLQVEPTGRPGIYQVSGRTNLPDHSRLSVLGVRYWQPTANFSPLQPANANYAILARDHVAVNQGRWETRLNLWQIAPDGRYQESWQLQHLISMRSVEAASQVTFLAIFELELQQQSITQRLNQQVLTPPLLRFTSLGQPYLQVSQTLPISLPLGKTTPPSIAAVDINGGWGNRSTLVSEPRSGTVMVSPPKEKQTNAPLPTAAFVR